MQKIKNQTNEFYFGFPKTRTIFNVCLDKFLELIQRDFIN